MAFVRIVGGELLGRRIAVPDVAIPGFRPATDRAKEAIFSTLASMVDIRGVRVVDLYAGTGALGFEALSRGADNCVFVERERVLCRNIEKHIDLFGVRARASVRVSSVESALEALEGPIQVVFAGPPFRCEPAPVIERVLKTNVLQAGSIAVFITEGETSVPASVTSNSLSGVLKKDRNYGDSAIRYYVLE